MRPLRSHVFLLIVLGAMTTAGKAQPPAVELAGKVTDENALPVAGVQVVLRSPDGNSQIVYSDEAGLFAVQFPSPGDFLVDLTKAGFFRMSNQPIHLQEGKNLLSLTLSHEFELHETVEVIASPGQIQPEETTHEQTLEAHDILDIPSNKTHGLGSYLSSLPSVFHDNSGGLHVAGGRGGETEYRLNGFEIGDPATGELTGRVNVDTVRAVNLEAGSYGAEYPHAGAGVVELETYAGDDRWRFGTTNFLPGFNFQQGLSFGNWFPRFTFSGPIRKGRAWFSEAVSLQHSVDLIQELPRGANTMRQWAGDNLLRIQVNLTPRHVLQGDFLTNGTRDSHLGLGPFSPLATTTNLHATRYFVSVKDQITLE
ncbi:MAG: carboxypeptidase regulatory-like domain-containing protein, partial [Acidobacteria bacterium]|nr:carboxypeptidase regulatory-like domain-containing protein [Acidobacteriota bacterium]